MKFSIRQAKYVKSTSLKVLMVLGIVSLINGLSISPAFADRNEDRGRGEQHSDRGDRGDQRAQRDHREGRGHRYEHGRGYGYEEPVYVPPPVYYEPRPSPGINLFFPLDLRR